MSISALPASRRRGFFVFRLTSAADIDFPRGEVVTGLTQTRLRQRLRRGEPTKQGESDDESYQQSMRRLARAWTVYRTAVSRGL